MMRMLIREYTVRLNWIFAKKRLPLNLMNHIFNTESKFKFSRTRLIEKCLLWTFPTHGAAPNLLNEGSAKSWQRSVLKKEHLTLDCPLK
ncbi:hypothetical protein DPMN_078804 [Dreissena polymorpha]|uniref:Uncharacterized protein n=1 Tax=Dreissena polymorpha TaxID=45954 RepID=A0A9D4BQK9_DREPO|nr:hypothetical protein DPMN_078804 [Dreissena polymorpha]